MLKPREILAAALASLALVLAIDAVTNELDIERFYWDFAHYIALAQHGFAAEPLVSPFVYRYATPMIVRGIASSTPLDIHAAFRLVATVGGVVQLLAVFLLTAHLTRSRLSGSIALMVTAFSFCNVKFLQFDVYRMDHLAYGWVVLCFWLCLRHRLTAAAIATVVGLQFREFVLVPLAASWLSLAVRRDFGPLLRQWLPFLLCIGVGVVLPRLWISVTADAQALPFSWEGIPRLVTVPMKWKRDLNLVFCVLAYVLPTAMLLTRPRLLELRDRIDDDTRLLCGLYSGLVVLLALYGGTDLARFVSYLFIPQAVLIGFLAQRASRAELVVMGLGVFIFNRVPIELPMGDLDSYLDFYGGYSSRLNAATALRSAEWLVVLAAAFAVRRIESRPTAANEAPGPGNPSG